MLRFRHRLSLMLAGLLLLQALAVAHAFDHPIGQHADHECVACPHGHGGAAIPPPAADVIPAPPARGHAHATHVRPPATASVRGYNSRAPPLSARHHG